MASSSRSTLGSANGDLNEVIQSLNKARDKVFKSSDGKYYLETSNSEVKKWVHSLREIRDKAPLNAEAGQQIATAESKIIALQEQIRVRDETLARIQSDKKKLELSLAAKTAELKPKIDAHAREAAKAKEDVATLSADLVATNKALAEARERLKNANRFDGETQQKYVQQIKDFEADTLKAKELIGQLRVDSNQHANEADRLRKELAAQKQHLASLKTDEATFLRALEFAKKGITSKSGLTEQELKDVSMYYGQKAADALKSLMDLPPIDVKGRLLKLKNMIRSGWLKLPNAKGMMGVLSHALDIIHDEGKSVLAILAPWLELILKDLLSGNIGKPEKYRKDLALRIAAVRKAPELKHKPLKEKIEASRAAGEKPNKSFARIIREHLKGVRSSLAKISGWASTATRAVLNIGPATVRCFKFGHRVATLCDEINRQEKANYEEAVALGDPTPPKPLGFWAVYRIAYHEACVEFGLRSPHQRRYWKTDRVTPSEPIVMFDATKEKGKGKEKV